MSQPTIRKILVVALDNLGDAVMATAVLKPLRDRYPSASIGLWVKKYAALLFTDQSLVDTLHAADPFWDVSPGHGKGSWSEFRKALDQVAAANYDIALILNTEWRRALACKWAGVRERVGFDRRKSRFLLTTAVPGPSPDQHSIEDHRQLLEAWLGPLPGPFVPRLDLSHEERRWAGEWIRQRRWNGHSLLALHPFAGHARRCWPLTQWAALVRRLTNTDGRLRFVALHGPGEGAGLSEAFADLSKEHVFVLGEARINQVKALLGHASLFIGGDSGPGHVAAALSVPVISLFGDSNPDRCAPRGPAQIKIIKRPSVTDITVDDVAMEVEDVLKKLHDSAAPL